MPNETIKDVYQIEAEVAASETRTTRIDAVLAAIQEAVSLVAENDNYARLDSRWLWPHNSGEKINAPRRGAEATIDFKERPSWHSGERDMMQLAIRRMCGEVALRDLDCTEPLFAVKSRTRPYSWVSYDRDPNDEVLLRRIEPLPDDDESRAVAIRAIDYFYDPHDRREVNDATHVLWTPFHETRKEKGRVYPSLINADRDKRRWSVISVPQAQSDRSLERIVARTLSLYQRDLRRAQHYMPSREQVRQRIVGNAFIDGFFQNERDMGSNCRL